jgi:hypothetical protein
MFHSDHFLSLSHSRQLPLFEESATVNSVITHNLEPCLYS